MLKKYRRVALILIFVLSAVSPSTAELAMTSVIDVDLNQVTIEAGSQDGVEVGVNVILLRKNSPIVHPLTGELLGVPEEPVGTIEIMEVLRQKATGQLFKMYSDPQVGDIAEYEVVYAKEEDSEIYQDPTLAEQDESRKQRIEDESLVSVLEMKMDRLAQKVAENQNVISKIQGGISVSPAIWDEITTMKSFFFKFEDRLLALEDRQGENSKALSNLNQEGNSQLLPRKELTISYARDIDVKVGVRGKTLLLDVFKDSLALEQGEVQETGFESEDTTAGNDNIFSWAVTSLILAWLGVLSFLFYRKRNPRESKEFSSPFIDNASTFETGDDE